MALSKVDDIVYNLLNNSPFDIGYYHPYIVDFALVVPMMAIFMHFVSLLTQSDENTSKAFLKMANLLFFMGILFIFLAYITGVAEGNEIRNVLSVEGKGIFDAHKSMGIYLLLFFLILLFMKIVSLIVKKEPVRYIFGTFLFFAILMLIYQDFVGISLVYDYGAGVYCAR